MKVLYTESTMIPRKLSYQICDTELIQAPFSEEDILNLQDTFLTKGFHHIKVATINDGRSIISMFLESLPSFKKIACLTASSIPLEGAVTDLHKKITEIALRGHYELELFLNEEFYYDFVWIELTKSLLEQTSLEILRANIARLNTQDLMPILVVSYAQ